MPRQQPPPPYRRTLLRGEEVDAAPVPAPILEQPPAAPSFVMSELPPPAVVSVAPRMRETTDWRALSGWIAAAAVLAFGIAFYTLAYLPLRSDFSSLEQASATQLKQRDGELVALRAELVASQGREQRAAAAAAATVAPVPTQIAAVEVEAHPRTRAKNEQVAPQPATAEPKPPAVEAKHAAATPKQAAAEPQPTEARTAIEAHESSESKTKGKVDVAAAAAATAALEAQVYGGDKPKSENAVPPSPYVASEPKATPARPAPPQAKESPSQPSDTAPRAAEKAAPPGAKDSLSDIDRGSSDDPLEGL